MTVRSGTCTTTTTRGACARLVRVRVLFAVSLAFVLAASPGCADEAPVRLPTRSVPRVARRDDGGLVLQASAFVELHVWLVFLATHPRTHVPDAVASAKARYAEVFADEPSDALARATTEALAACDDLPCAKKALAAARLDDAFESALPYFEKNIWPQAFAHADRALSRLRAALPDASIVTSLVTALAKALLADDAPVARLDVVHESPLYEDDPLAPLALEDTAPCLRGQKRDDPEALACALFQVALAMRSTSRIYQSIDAEAEHGPAGRRRTMRLYALVAAHAARIGARAGSSTTNESFTAGLLAREPELEAFFVARWPSRGTPDFARGLSQAATR